MHTIKKIPQNGTKSNKFYLEFFRKFVFLRLFSFGIEELRCYRDKRDKKPEKIFDLKDFEVKFEEKGQGLISIKNPLQIGCFIRGANRQETKQVFQKIVSMRGK